MIYSFRSKEAKAIWEGDFVKSLSPDIQIVARRKLRMLNAAKLLEDLRMLKTERRGLHSIGIDDRWRACFVWTGRGAKEVEIVE